jgi:hypothetical protein
MEGKESRQVGGWTWTGSTPDTVRTARVINRAVVSKQSPGEIVEPSGSAGDYGRGVSLAACSPDDHDSPSAGTFVLRNRRP